MSQQEDEALLGSRERSHITDTRRMLIAAMWGIVVGAVFTVISVVVVVDVLSSPWKTNTVGPNYFVSLMIAIALLLPWSVVRLVKGLRRRGESYMVHEQGFVHHAPARDEVVRWSHVAAVHQAGEEKSGGLLHALALDYRCRVVCSDGRKFKLNSYTDNAQWFAKSVSRHVSESKASNP